MNPIKKVNIDVRVPIRNMNMPLSVGKYYNVEMHISDIFKCICSRALVDEILSDGKLLRLDLRNYNTDNEPAKPMVKEESKVEETKTEEVKIENTESEVEVKKESSEETVQEAKIKSESYSEDTSDEVIEKVEVEESKTEETKVEPKKHQHNRSNNNQNRKSGKRY